MPFLLVGITIIAVLAVMLISIWLEEKKPYFRLVSDGTRYIIQYRYMWVRWKTYILMGTDNQPAVYYTRMEAEDMIKKLIKRRAETKSLDKIGSSVKVINYDDDGRMMSGRD